MSPELEARFNEVTELVAEVARLLLELEIINIERQET